MDNLENVIGKRLDGRYLLEGLIGVGGMANVYRAQDLKEDRICELMVPRAEMVCLRENMSRDEVLETARRSPHSRYPVVSERDPESFSGVLEIRQLLFNDGDWRGLLRPAPVVSGDEFQLLLAENIEKLDSRLLLVKGKSSEIIGMITTNDLLMKLFQKAEPGTAA